MKKITSYLIALILIGSGALNAMDAKLQQQIEKQLKELKSAKGVEAWEQGVTAFEAMSKSHPEAWLTRYYESYCLLNCGMESKDPSTADSYYDRAIKAIDAADAVSVKNSEIKTLKSWILSMQIGIDPMNRGFEYGMKSNMLLEEAMTLDENNPRPYLLQGLAALYTPEEYGGSKEKAKSCFEKSIKIFESAKVKSATAPSWGYEKAKESLAEIQ
ncbi:MAG: hypothetical protein IPI23_16980 [Bacteroidetes bacterium]|nr:hypothetical protein [Bacteroidota bacterium]